MSNERIRVRETGPRSYVGIVVSGARYALDVRRIREIVRPSVVAPLPQGAAGLVGVAYHRGEVVPVVDVRMRLGARTDAPGGVAEPDGARGASVSAPHPNNPVPMRGEGAGARDRSQWVLARVRDARLVALVVDAVDGVYASSPREAQAPSPVAGVHLRGGALVLELDVDALAAPAVAIELPSAEGHSG